MLHNLTMDEVKIYLGNYGRLNIVCYSFIKKTAKDIKMSWGRTRIAPPTDIMFCTKIHI